ncbi:hypothetical protein LOD99_959 [Oopsacas minuta]|uniref:Uncharacterized protein n=1 Tax=Oopsacas minuta TaxID=111878 RepID=A0AAV7K0U9_9METZ|nr:hypothetical protein LOD99_959 [Oopsacas minuta]
MASNDLEHFQSRISTLIARVESFYSHIHDIVERKETLLIQLQELQNSWKVNSEKILNEIDSKLSNLRESSSKLFTNNLIDAEENICLSFQKYFQLCYPNFLPTLVHNSELEVEYLGSINYESVAQYRNKIYPQQSISKIGSGIDDVMGVRAVKFDSEDGEERVYVADAGNHRIQVFSVNGEYLFNFGVDILSSPWGLCTKLPGRVLVSDDIVNAVYCFNKSGRILTEKKGDDNTIDWNPLGIDACPDSSEIFIADSKHNRIVILDINFYIISYFCSDSLSSPRDVHVNRDKVFVLDKSQYCVHTFSRPDYLHLTQVIQYTSGTDFFSIDSRSNIILSVTVSHCIHIYTTTGEFIHRIGWFGEKRGKLVFPTGVDCTKDWRIVVISSRLNGPIQVY